MNAWIEQNIFSSQQAAKGGIMRQSIANVERFASEEALLEAAKAHGFMVFVQADQYVLLGTAEFKVLLGP